jgi:hypothetical protein
MKLQAMVLSEMPFSKTGSHKRALHVKRMLHKCNKKLSRTTSQNFCLVWNAAIFSPEDRDSWFLRTSGMYLRVYNPEASSPSSELKISLCVYQKETLWLKLNTLNQFHATVRLVCGYQVL